MSDLLDHIIELKSMVSELKAKTEGTNDKIDDHIEWCTIRDSKVDSLRYEVSEAQSAIRETKATIKTIKWAVPVISAAVAATLKLVGRS